MNTDTPTGADTPSLHVDWTRCDGRGLCTELLPELLARDTWGYPIPRGGIETPVSADLRGEAREAVRGCPRLALSLLQRG
jgi:ferredoxin